MPSVRATRRRRRALGAAAALALVASVVSCGSDSKSAGLSEQRASTLRSTLDRIDQRVASRDCTGAATQVSQFRREVASLPSRVDRDLRNALDDSAARLETLVADQCKPATTTPTGEAPVEPSTEGNATDQQNQDEKDKKSKKPKKPKDEQPPPDTGGSGPTGSTGLTGPEGTTLPPEGG
jgi:hypothetical protein